MSMNIDEFVKAKREVKEAFDELQRAIKVADTLEQVAEAAHVLTYAADKLRFVIEEAN